MSMQGLAAANDFRERTLVGYAPAPVPVAGDVPPPDNQPGDGDQPVPAPVAFAGEEGAPAELSPLAIPRQESSPLDRRNPLSRRDPINRGRHLTRQFFEEGERQEERGWENSALATGEEGPDSAVSFESFDQVPSRRGPRWAVGALAAVAVGGLAAWAIGSSSGATQGAQAGIWAALRQRGAGWTPPATMTETQPAATPAAHEEQAVAPVAVVVAPAPIPAAAPVPARVPAAPAPAAVAATATALKTMAHPVRTAPPPPPKAAHPRSVAPTKRAAITRAAPSYAVAAGARKPTTSAARVPAPFVPAAKRAVLPRPQFKAMAPPSAGELLTDAPAAAPFAAPPAAEATPVELHRVETETVSAPPAEAPAAAGSNDQPPASVPDLTEPAP